MELLQRSTEYKNEPTISAISAATRIVYIAESDDPLSLLDFWGRQMQRYRSWGRLQKVNGMPHEKNFEDDHDWFRKIGNYRSSDFHPRRIIFGLPHNYGSKTQDGVVTGTIHERRASPLLFHIHEFSPKKYGAIALLLPSLFLPADEKINAGGKPVTQKIQWEVLTKFIDSQNYFPGSNTWIGERI